MQVSLLITINFNHLANFSREFKKIFVHRLDLLLASDLVK